MLPSSPQTAAGPQSLVSTRAGAGLEVFAIFPCRTLSAEALWRPDGFSSAVIQQGVAFSPFFPGSTLRKKTILLLPGREGGTGGSSVTAAMWAQAKCSMHGFSRHCVSCGHDVLPPGEEGNCFPWQKDKIVFHHHIKPLCPPFRTPGKTVHYYYVNWKMQKPQHRRKGEKSGRAVEDKLLGSSL